MTSVPVTELALTLPAVTFPDTFKVPNVPTVLSAEVSTVLPKAVAVKTLVPPIFYVSEIFTFPRTSST